MIVEARKPRVSPLVSTLVFDGQVVITFWHWAAFLLAGAIVPTCILAATHYLPARHKATLSPMEVVLASPDPVKPPEPKATEPRPPDPPPKQPVSPDTGIPRSNVKARAGKVIAAAPHAPAAQVRTSSPIVTGEGRTYAGGATTSSGQSDQPVENVAQALPAPEPPKPKAPDAPPVDTVAVTKAYLAEIRDLLAREKRYPIAAQRLGVEGTAIVAFVILADGHFDQVRLVASSGNDLLDEAAIEAVRRLSGRVLRPKATGTLPLPLKVALRFELVH